MTTPLNVTTASSTPTRSVIERIDVIHTAWAEIAPEVLFGDTTRAEFEVATAPSRVHRTELATLKANQKAASARRMIGDKSTRLAIKRVIGAVVADAAFGPDSGLYRAMGYIRLSERQSGSHADPSWTAPKVSQPSLMDRLNQLVSAWNELAPGVSLAGMTPSQFTVATNPSREARAALETTRTNYSGGIAARDHADAASMALIKRVVAGVRSNVNYGDDSPLYRAMGYKRASERRSAKRTSTGVPAVPAPSAVA